MIQKGCIKMFEDFITDVLNALNAMFHSGIFWLFLLFVLIGILIACSTFFMNREGKKHGFKGHKYYGMSKRIDKKVSKVYQGNEDYVPYHDSDNLEQHANKKWK